MRHPLAASPPLSASHRRSRSTNASPGLSRAVIDRAAGSIEMALMPRMLSTPHLVTTPPGSGRGHIPEWARKREDGKVPSRTTARNAGKTNRWEVNSSTIPQRLIHTNHSSAGAVGRHRQQSDPGPWARGRSCGNCRLFRKQGRIRLLAFRHLRLIRHSGAPKSFRHWRLGRSVRWNLCDARRRSAASWRTCLM
jgi:hypothetical protein